MFAAMQRIGLRVLALVVCVWLIPSTARADEIVYSGSGTGVNGVTLSASATFSISGNILTITLVNEGDTSGTGEDLSANTLTGLFFDLPTGITLTPTSATISGDDLVNGAACDACPNPTNNVGGEFVYASGTWTGHDGNQGISSSGYIAGGSANFNGPDLDQPVSPDGINFGIIGPGEFNPNGGLANDPLISEQVVFVMTISGGDLLASQISNVSFQYGTDISEPKFVSRIRIQAIPEPGTLLLFGSAAAVELVRRRRRARASV